MVTKGYCNLFHFQDLLDIGIINRGHRKKLLHEIEKLPPEEMDQEVPVSFKMHVNLCSKVF